jgi:hypothetical protein
MNKALMMKRATTGQHHPFFLTAAQQEDTTFFEFFIEHWNERFASSGGRDQNGDAPMDHLCRDPRVSMQAVKLMATKYGANIFMAAGDNGVPPFFVTAAHREDTTLFEFFIDHWNEHFAASGGRDNNGDAPMDHLCRDPRVSIQAVTLLVTKYKANISVAAGNGWFPLHSAIMSEAKLEVIYYLLYNGPGILVEQRFPIGPPVVYYRDRSLQTDNESLQADSEPHQPTMESLQATIESQQATIESQQATIESFQDDKAALQAEIDLLRQTLGDNCSCSDNVSRNV